jgi:coenzyme PQQ precursor peptide PqqA
MAPKTVLPRDKRRDWETPTAEEIRVSAEATMYMGAWKDEDWV